MDMEVPLVDLRAQYAEIREEVHKAVEAVFESQRFILGPSVKRLEEQIAAYTEVKYGIGVSSGTDALLVSLMALDLGWVPRRSLSMLTRTHTTWPPRSSGNSWKENAIWTKILANQWRRKRDVL
jgi:hypothetical protein